MKQPFVTRYRPKMFSDFENDSEIIELLTRFIDVQDMHLLLMGPSGSGKTTLIKVLVNEYYKGIQKMDVSDNVLIINVLKDQGIQYYRETVKSFCQTTCTIPGKKKTIVIDDLDNINEQSQQVFRNCIDKYKHNINFLTTGANCQKIIESMQSRLMILKIASPTIQILRCLINKIVKQEKIDITSEAIEFTLRICNGSTKLLINYLEKFALLKQSISLPVVNTICTNIYFERFDAFNALAIMEKNFPDAVRLLYTIYDEGYSVMDILDSYFTYVKQCPLSEEHKYKVIKIICKYISIFNLVHEHEIELIFFIKELVQIDDV